MSSIQTNIYDTNVFFAILYNGVRTFILEPKGWDQINNHIPRDPTYYGFTADFLEDNYGMLFSFIDDGKITGGGALLKNIYETIGMGPNSQIFFQFGLMNSNTPVLLNQWRINLNEYEYDDTINGGVAVTIEKMPFQAKYRSRASVPCTINNYNNMDGDILTPISTWQLRLHSKTLLEESIAQSPQPQISNEISSHVDSYFFIQPDQTNLIASELATVYTQPMGLIDTASTNPNTTGTPGDPSTSGLDNSAFSPFKDKINQYTAQTAGLLNISYAGHGTFYYWRSSTDLIGWAVTPRVVVQRLIGGVATIVNVVVGTTKIVTVIAGAFSPPISPTPPIVGTFPFNPGAAPILSSVTGGARANCVKIEGWAFDEEFANIPIEANDLIYVHCIMCPAVTGGTGVPGFVQIDNYENDITYSQLTTTPGTTAPAYRIFDVITQLLENVTGQKNGLISSFFSPGGDGYKYLITNGYGIRNFGGPAYMMRKDLQGITADMQAMFGLGMGFRNINGVDYMVLEKASFFFKNRIIGVYKNTSGWKEKNSTKWCFNKADIGFNKYEGLNLVQQDEFCTEGSYLLQDVIYNNNTLSKKSNIIAAGYIIESQRRQQFLANPGQSLTFDNDIFIIATAEPCVFDASTISTDGLPIVITFSASSSQFGVSITSAALQPGDKIQTTTGINSGTVFTVVSEVSGYPIYGADEYIITPAPLDEIINTGLTITPPSPNQIFAERNQPFKICSNVIDPSTIYNGRLSMDHILFNWREVLGIGLYFLNPGSQNWRVSKIVPTLIKMNSLFTSQFLPTEPNKGNIGDLLTVEINRINVSDFMRNGTSLFMPTEAECKIKIGWNEMNVIRYALSGSLGDDTKDNGGLVLADDNNVLWFCHVMDILYNLKNQMATLQVQKVYKLTL